MRLRARCGHLHFPERDPSLANRHLPNKYGGQQSRVPSQLGGSCCPHQCPMPCSADPSTLTPCTPARYSAFPVVLTSVHQSSPRRVAFILFEPPNPAWIPQPWGLASSNSLPPGIPAPASQGAKGLSCTTSTVKNEAPAGDCLSLSLKPN